MTDDDVDGDDLVEVDDVDPVHLALVHLRELLTTSAAWRARAACRGEDPDLFFPHRGEDTSVPAAICARCPVTVECLDYAIDAHEKFGMWGGASERERRRIRRDRRLDQEVRTA